ncbi:MAG: hypothetical protein ABSE73_21145 [Planctomycetota bacterium]
MGAVTESSPALRRWARALLLAVLVAAGCVLAVKLLTPRVRDLEPEELKARMGDGSLELEKAIELVNKLDAGARREVMQSPQAQSYFQSLPPAQRIQFVRRTLDRGIQEQLDRYKKMNKEERKAFVVEVQERQREARERMSRLTPEEKKELRDTLNSSDFTAVVEKAVKTYLRVSSSEERAELAPLFDGALENLDYAKGL